MRSGLSILSFSPCTLPPPPAPTTKLSLSQPQIQTLVLPHSPPPSSSVQSFVAVNYLYSIQSSSLSPSPETPLKHCLLYLPRPTHLLSLFPSPPTPPSPSHRIRLHPISRSWSIPGGPKWRKSSGHILYQVLIAVGRSAGRHYTPVPRPTSAAWHAGSQNGPIKCYLGRMDESARPEPIAGADLGGCPTRATSPGSREGDDKGLREARRHQR